MTPAEREKAFRKERRRQLKRYVVANRKALRQVEKILREGQGRVRAEIADSNLSDFQSWQLPNLTKSIEIALGDVGSILGNAASDAAEEGFQIGVDLVDAPLKAGGISIIGRMPDLDLRQLSAIRAFMVDRMKDISTEAASKIKTEIGVIMIGGQTPGQAIDNVAAIIKGSRGRALGVVRTNMGSAFSMATQERQTQAREHLPGLKKQWRRSGKVYSRQAHDMADGQIVDVDQPFIVNGIEMMYPRDPKAPIKEVINCGCVQLPFMEHWDVRQPGRQPFSDREIFNNPLKRDIARELNPPLDPAGPGLSSIRALEVLSPQAAKREIAERLATEDFRNFAAGRVDRDHRPLGVIPENLAAPLGAQTQVVRLSSYTAIKQIERRRGELFNVGDYAKVQRILDRGDAYLDKETHLVVFGAEKNEKWKAVFKRTQDRKELYLESMHRTNARQQRLAKKNLKQIRGED